MKECDTNLTQKLTQRLKLLDQQNAELVNTMNMLSMKTDQQCEAIDKCITSLKKIKSINVE